MHLVIREMCGWLDCLMRCDVDWAEMSLWLQTVILKKDGEGCWCRLVSSKPKWVFTQWLNLTQHVTRRAALCRQPTSIKTDLQGWHESLAPLQGIRSPSGGRGGRFHRSLLFIYLIKQPLLPIVVALSCNEEQSTTTTNKAKLKKVRKGKGPISAQKWFTWRELIQGHENGWQRSFSPLQAASEVTLKTMLSNAMAQRSIWSLNYSNAIPQAALMITSRSARKRTVKWWKSYAKQLLRNAVREMWCAPVVFCFFKHSCCTTWEQSWEEKAIKELTALTDLSCGWD